MSFLTDKPFCLNHEQEEWVFQRLAAMSVEEKIGQLLCPCVQTMDPNSMKHVIQDLHVGAVMLRPFPTAGLKEFVASLQEMSSLPLLIAANLENGGSGVLQEGTLFSNPLGIAATGEPLEAYRLGKISTSQASSVGVNWAFAPVVDLDLNYHNPITNVRTFGNQPQKVIDFARAYIQSAHEEQVLAAIKHFPGDGVDERDQHLLTSVNSLSFEEWQKTYGNIYSTLIQDGIKTIMVGHIAQPGIAKHVNPSLSEEEAYLPGSLSSYLVQDFLRKELGFQGLAITDSTLMVGYLEKMPRKKALSCSINAGIDMILFSRNIDEDYRYLWEEYQEGALSLERIDEACLRILGIKAGLPTSNDKKSIPLSQEICQQWTQELADKAITLVKDNHAILPLDPTKTKRIFLNVIENKPNNQSRFAAQIKEKLQQEGFVVTLQKRDYPDITPSRLFSGELTQEEIEALSELGTTTDQFVHQYDLAMIVLDEETASNATVLRVNWNVLFGMGNDIPWYSGELPLLVASFSNPYHLLDIPMADAYINCYTPNQETIAAFFEKIMGRIPFKGSSPIDPFCHHGDTKL